jgi:hypothetical protein
MRLICILHIEAELLAASQEGLSSRELLVSLRTTQNPSFNTFPTMSHNLTTFTGRDQIY